MNRQNSDYENKVKAKVEKCLKIKIVRQAIKYAEDVVSGVEVAPWEVQKQCEIILEDWNVNQYKEDWEYTFSYKHIKRIAKIIKLMKFATGFVAGQSIYDHLAPYQAFLIVNLFGWRYKTRLYKFKHNDITLYVSRKNAKTATVGIIFILLMLTEQNFSEFYSICLNKDLAAEIRKSMVQILQASPLLEQQFTISLSKLGKLECKITKSFFEPRVAKQIGHLIRNY